VLGWLRIVASRIRGWLSRRPADEEFARELESHLEMLAQENVRRGMPPDEARRAARVRLGGMTQISERHREMHTLLVLETFVQDIRYGLRTLRKTPGFTTVAVLTLALGIGANTAIFSLINAAMLRSLPVPEPERLVMLQYAARRDPDVMGGYFWGCPGKTDPAGHRGCSFSHPMYEQIHAQQTVFSGLSAFVGSHELHLDAGGRRSMVRGDFVGGDFFSTLGLGAEIGRTLEPSDDAPGAAPAAVLRYGYWRTQLGGDPSVIGKSVSLEGVAVTIVGVVARGFSGLDAGLPDDIWLPLASQPLLLPGRFRWDMPNSVWTEMVARLGPGVTKTQAASAVTTIFVPRVTGPGAIFKPEDEPRIELAALDRGLGSLRREFSEPLLVLMAAVGIILLLATANIAGLMLARGASRWREIAVRLALGAPRWRILGQLLTESLLLAAAATVFGTLLAYWGAYGLATFLASNWREHLQIDVRPDLSVLVFTGTVSVLAAICFGLAPGLLGTRLDLTHALKGSSESQSLGSHGERRRLGLGNALVVAQVALSVILVAGAGLLVHTLIYLERMNVGFDTRNVLLVHIDPNIRDWTDPRIPRLCRDLQARFAALPGVISASYSMVPLLSESNMDTMFRSLGASKESAISSDELPVGTNFFETMHIPLLAGRTFEEEDFRSNAKPSPIIVNRKLAQRLFGKDNPIGQLFRDSRSKTADYEVIGVVADAKYNDLKREIRATAYVPLKVGGGSFELRTSGDFRALIPAVRAAVREVKPDVVVTRIQTQTEQIERTLYQERLFAGFSSLFGVLALILACVGLYGLLSYEVTRRTREIGIRIALGASRQEIRELVAKRGLLLTLLGTVVGIAAAVTVTRYLQTLLYGVKPTDLWTLGGIVVLLGGVAMVACYLPARRAMRVDPMVALRYE
jgi:predicted permease